MRHRAVVPLVLAVAACGSAGPKVTLRYHPPAGAIYQFGTEQRTMFSVDSGPMAQLGKRQMLMRLYFTESVKGPTSGGTEVELLFETVTMEIPGINPSLISRSLAGLQRMRATMVFDDRGTVVRSEFAQARGVAPDMTKRLSEGVTGLAPGFPDHPVGRGDSWTVASELPLDEVPGFSASTGEVARTTFTVREIRVEGSDTSVVLDIRTEFPSEPIRLASGGESGTLTLTGSITGHQVFSLPRGTVVDGAMKGIVKMSFSDARPGSPGMSMQLENEQSIVLLSTK